VVYIINKILQNDLILTTFVQVFKIRPAVKLGVKKVK
jgi:hypothetical protein